jgi:hypothetical protein
LIVGVAIEKSFTFRGGTQPFSNVYYYEGPVTVSSDVALNALVDKIVAKEKERFSTEVAFVRGRCWKADGTESENVMIVDKNLSGTGALSPSTNLDRERAFLVRFRAGSDSRGRPVYLRKFWHFDASTFFTEAISNDQLKNKAQISSTARGNFESWANFFKQIDDAGAGLPTMNLVSKNGRDISGATQAHPYIEHRQLGEEWRGV